MSYTDLVDRLENDRDPRRVVALPDGSVDRCYAVDGLDGDRLESRESFGRQLLEGEGDTFGLEPIAVRPGGQAVNAARQAHALGERVTLVAPIEHPAMADFPFETRSTGEPSTIHLLAFDDEEVLLADRSGEPDAWSIDALLDAIEWERLASADALSCTNWASYRGLTDVFERLASDPPDDVPVVVDPGRIETADEAAVRSLLDALSAAESTTDVALSVNRTECETVADAAGVDGETVEGLLTGVRGAIDLTAAVFHGTERAVAATRDGVVDVPMLSVDETALTTGAGDRFSAGLGVALAHDWGWNAALALGNACSAAFVASGETADANALVSFVRERR